MPDVAAHEPLKIGLIGVSPDGRHLIETMSVGGPFRVVMAWDDQRNLANAAESLGVPVVSDLNSLLAAREVEALWLARPLGLDEPFAELLLRHGKSIVGELPLGLSAERVASVLAEARSLGIPVLSHCPRRSDANFLRAQSAVLSGDLCTLLAAKWGSWSYAPDQRPQTLLRLLAQAVDQLLQLIPTEPLRVVAFGDSALSIQTVIEFCGGTRAEIDLRLDSPVPYQTGWLLTGDRGGFADGRGFHVAADGEVFDTPAPTIESVVNPYAELAQRLRVLDGAASDTDRTMTVTKLMASIRSSVKSGQVIHV